MFAQLASLDWNRIARFWLLVGGVWALYECAVLFGRSLLARKPE